MPSDKELTRVTARVLPSEFSDLQFAAEITGTTVSQFVRRAAVEKAHAMTSCARREMERIVVTTDSQAVHKPDEDSTGPALEGGQAGEIQQQLNAVM
jgi:uncharacterized protein (DUF1778 family)